jgi:hypothetical protein
MMYRKILILVFVLLFKTNQSTGHRPRDMFKMFDGEKNENNKVVECLKGPETKCGTVLKVLMKNIDIDRVIKIIIKKHLQDKYNILKLLMKSYFRKKDLRRIQTKRFKIMRQLKHIIKIS